MDKKKLFIIIDGSSVIYRAFHAIPETLTNSRGLPTNAIYGFTQTLRKIIKEYAPDYIGVAFDVKGPSFRHAMFEGYKAERKPMPESLSAQMPYIRELVKAFRIPVMQMESYEADDVIATVAKKASSAGLKAAIISGDKDMLQLVNGNIVILDYLTGKEYGPPEVKEKFGVEAGQMRDYLGLAGDSVDNIPGVPGIGPKTAAKLLSQFKDLEDIYANVEDYSGAKVRENLKNFREQAFISRDLATLHPEVPIELDFSQLEYSGPDMSMLEPMLKEFDFIKILKEMLPAAQETKALPAEFKIALNDSDVKACVDEIKALNEAAVCAFLSDEAFIDLNGIGIAANKDHEAFYFPVKSVYGAGASEDFIASSLADFIKDEDIRKNTDNAKPLYLFFGKKGIEANGIGIDTSLASYLLNPSKTDHSIDSLSYEYLGKMAEEDGKGPVDLPAAAQKICSRSMNIAKVAEVISGRLEAEPELLRLYREMELPLSKVLADMEISGIKMDAGKLKLLSKETAIELDEIERKVYAAAGGEFNLNSPKQLSELLFTKLGLKPVKKTKTGFSTDEEVLTQLAERHEIPQMILSYRQLAKLKSTYIDALSALIDAKTGRIHTSFNQTVTATGRLSSSRPNLQNIPVRGEAAGRVRECFVPESGFCFVSADYSQIELRILAHMAGDPVLIDSFQNGEDIHARTASEVFGVMPGLVTPEMRRRAKAINFGIVYGMGPYGLAAELKIPQREAAEYIDRYFEHYGKVREFIDSTIKSACEKGFTTTLFGRKRYIPELSSPVDSTVRLGHRLAVNTPIQGSAADIIKAAMIRIHDRLSGNFRSRMILQIHDELIFEAAIEERDKLIALVKEEMEGVVKLGVPIIVNVKTGANWRDVEEYG